MADQLVRRSVWIVGGDGWAYDIGSGGLDHVLASGRDVNVLVLDTEVYSNTGGQASKATPLGGGGEVRQRRQARPRRRTWRCRRSRTATSTSPASPWAPIRSRRSIALREAEAYEGPSLVLAYSHCIAHGIDMRQGLDQQSRAVHSGYWPLCATTRSCAPRGEPPFTLDSVRPTMPFRAYAEQELRYRMLLLSDPARGERPDARRPGSGRRASGSTTKTWRC